MTQTVRAVGSVGLLLECDPDDVVGFVAAVDDAVAAGAITGAIDVVAGASSVLVVLERPLPDGPELLARLTPRPVHAPASQRVRIPVQYDGADLAEVARRSGLGVGEVIERHSRALYVVAFSGFAPGFAYLRGLDPLLVGPRRASPRTRVPAGSVAIAGEYSAVYPGESPGGWHLLGRSSASVFDPARQPPSDLVPGTVVEFEPVAELPTAPTPPDVVPSHAERWLDVLDVGGLALVQDLGRPGFGRLAVGRSGAFDRRAHRLANRLVGNPESAAGLEVVGGGVTLRASSAVTMAVTGADVPIWVDGHAADAGAAMSVPAGSVVVIGRPRRGLRASVGLRGGIVVRTVLGSASRDTLGGLGPAPLVPGDRLPIGTAALRLPAVDHVPIPPIDEVVRLGVHRGPRVDWFPDRAWGDLIDAEWLVSPDSDRIGVRLVGPRLPRARAGELAPEGMVRGCVQVPPSGQPVVLGPDHPVTGGYPVIAVVDDPDALAQAPPGTRVRLRPIG